MPVFKQTLSPMNVHSDINYQYGGYKTLGINLKKTRTHIVLNVNLYYKGIIVQLIDIIFLILVRSVINIIELNYIVTVN